MSDAPKQKLQCFLAQPYSTRFQSVRDAIKQGCEMAGFQLVSSEDSLSSISIADCVIADVTGRNPNVFYEIGMAQAMEKPIFSLTQEDEIDFFLSYPIYRELDMFSFVIKYETTEEGLKKLSSKIRSSLADYRKSPQRARATTGRRFATPFSVDWDRLDRVDAENLCMELLAQMGYQRIVWGKEFHEIDLVAELPKKDPDGFEYRELWLVAMGRNAPLELVYEQALYKPESFLFRLYQRSERLERLFLRGSAYVPVIVLIILLSQESNAFEFERRPGRKARQADLFPDDPMVRIRVWDRNYLTTLVQQFPQIGYKYFSDEGLFRLKTRKTYEELYQENVSLTNRQSNLIVSLEDEKNRRVRAERDAVWKDISFTAAHRIGNPLFAIETFLDPLQKRISEGKVEDALGIINSIRLSVEKAKTIIDQFKSLAKAQKITPVPTLLCSVLEDTCSMIRNQVIECETECASDVTVEADPNLLAECFDELALNAAHWFDKPEKKIRIEVSKPSQSSLPDFVDSSRDYALIHFQDGGCGIPLENKNRIFDAFFTTRNHGTGLGLAYVRRIIEGHGGGILESGLPGQGADFEIYLPLSDSAVPSHASKAKKGKN